MAGEPVYVDSSALVKLVLAEPETEALQALLPTLPGLITSAISAVEVVRATKASPPALESDARRLVDGCLQVAVDNEVIAQAQELADPRLRTLDAIHLASALSARAQRMVVYDRRLAQAARESGLEILAPC